MGLRILMYIHRYEFTIKLEEPATLPQYKGSMFRGAFGIAFKKSVCITGRPECDGCILQNNCSYFRVFETEKPVEKDISFMNGVAKMPHPYILVPPLDSGREYLKGDELTVSLSLFGNTVDLLPFFIYTFQQMGKIGIGAQRHRFRLEQVNVITISGLPEVIFTANSSKLLDKRHPLSIADLPHNTVPHSVIIQFLTPFRAQIDGRIITQANDVTSEVLLNALKRRVIALETLYGSGENIEIPGSNAGLVSLAENRLIFKDWERYSNRQQKKMCMGGFIGSLTLAGDLTPFWKLLRAGELIHIGKNAVFGLGKYRIIPGY